MRECILSILIKMSSAVCLKSSAVFFKLYNIIVMW